MPGLRVSEVMALQWSDFSFDQLTVRIQRSIAHGRVDDVKTEYSNDDPPLDPEYAALMLRWKQSCPSRYTYRVGWTRVALRFLFNAI